MHKKRIYTEKDDLSYEKISKNYLAINHCDINRCGLAYQEDNILERPNGRFDYYIMFVVRGKMRVLIDGEMLPVYPGDMIYIAPHTPQRFVRLFKDKPEHYFVHFIGYAVPEILKDIGLTKSGIYHIGKIDMISDAFQKIMMAIAAKENTTYINSLLLRLISYFSEIKQDEEMSLAASRVSPAIMQLNYEYARSTNMSYYASLCNMSMANFSVAFKRATGVSPLRFRENIRMEKAKKLLCESFLSIKEVANAVGYQDQYTFSKIFKKRIGVSPSEYRSKNKNDS
ncbi:MAG: AraC family transcriptional regulator [Clostridia bacterium]|nr:AraC family transcriptional regulator [Clostridia bacterium]